jgi:hypothetical protein
MLATRQFQTFVVLTTGFSMVAATVAWLCAAERPGTRTKIAARQENEPPLEPDQIDLKRSRVYIYVGKKGLGHEHGVEGKIRSGDPHIGAKEGAGIIEFDMASFAADTDRARKYLGLEGSTAASTREQVNKNMLGPDVLNVREFPTATFFIESALQKKTKQGKPVVELKGEFTLHGRARPLTLYAQPSEKDGQLHLRGEFSIRQTDFGITPYTAALGTVGVADQLKIFGDIWLAADQPADR